MFDIFALIIYLYRMIDSSMLSRGEKPKLSNRIVDIFVDRIARGELPAGSALPSESDLARQFDVSKPVVREALGQLAALGVLSIKQGRPTTIRAMGAGPLDDYFRIAIRANQSGLRDAIELRRALETEIAGLAAERMGVGDLADLAVVVRRMEITVDDTEPWLEADLAFHLALMRGAKNALLAHLVGALTDVMRLSIRAMGKQTDLRDTKATLARHVAIFDAVRARDPEAARRAMAAHFDATRPVVDAIIADRGRTQGIGLDDALEGGK